MNVSNQPSCSSHGLRQQGIGRTQLDPPATTNRRRSGVPEPASRQSLKITVKEYAIQEEGKTKGEPTGASPRGRGGGGNGPRHSPVLVLCIVMHTPCRRGVPHQKLADRRVVGPGRARALACSHKLDGQGPSPGRRGKSKPEPELEPPAVCGVGPKIGPRPHETGPGPGR